MHLQDEALRNERAQFERKQAATTEALGKFAPGFGAGHFLANAVNRSVTEVQKTSLALPW